MSNREWLLRKIYAKNFKDADLRKNLIQNMKEFIITSGASTLEWVLFLFHSKTSCKEKFNTDHGVSF